MKRLLTAVLLVAAGLPAIAQSSVPPNSGDKFKDTSILKPPPEVVDINQLYRTIDTALAETSDTAKPASKNVTRRN